MRTCKICQNIYLESREHCPVCGAFSVGQITYDIDNARELAVAYGAQRQDYARTHKMRIISCDPDQ